MTNQEIIVTSLIISSTGFFLDMWSSRLNDLFVRRVSGGVWLVTGVSVTIVCNFVYQQTGNVAAVTVSASLITIIGEALGIKTANHLKERRTRQVQQNAKRAAWQTQDLNS